MILLQITAKSHSESILTVDQLWQSYGQKVDSDVISLFLSMPAVLTAML